MAALRSALRATRPAFDKVAVVILWQRNVLALSIAQVVTQLAFSFALPLTPLYLRELGLRESGEIALWAGLIGAATSVTLTLTQPFWGQLADRVGHRPMVLRAMVGGSLIVTLQGFAGSPEQLLALRLLQGTVTGSVYASNALIATTAPRERMGFALGAMQVATLVGSALGPLIGGVIADTAGFRVSYCLAGLLMLLGALIVYGFCREHRVAAGRRPESAWRQHRQLMGLPAFPSMLLVIFLIQLATVIISPILSLFVAELSGEERAATEAGLVLAAGGAASAVAALTVGALSDRLGQRLILPICLLGSALTYLPQALVGDLWQLLLLRVLLGLFLGGLMPTATAMIAGLVPAERRGAAFGLVAMANSLAHASGPLAGAAIATQLGLRAVFLATGLLLLASAGWVLLGQRSVARPTSVVDDDR